MHSDIWSLGILLLILVTGRMPWRSANVQNDKEFATYVRRPSHFLSTQFPISQELRRLLLETLSLESRERISLPRLKMAVENMRTFYSREAVFLDGVAWCIWQIDCVDGANIEM
jgi:serine/threonine protein kinase